MDHYIIEHNAYYLEKMLDMGESFDYRKIIPNIGNDRDKVSLLIYHPNSDKQLIESLIYENDEALEHGNGDLRYKDFEHQRQMIRHEVEIWMRCLGSWSQYGDLDDLKKYVIELHKIHYPIDYNYLLREAFLSEKQGITAMNELVEMGADPKTISEEIVEKYISSLSPLKRKQARKEKDEKILFLQKK